MLRVSPLEIGGHTSALPTPTDAAFSDAALSTVPAAGCWCDTESWSGPDGEILVLRVSGEIDLLSRPDIASALVEAVSRAPRHLVVDLAATGFCCVAGYGLLGETGFVSAARGIGFALSGLTAHQDRVASMVLPRPGPARYRSAAAAVTALRIDDAPRPGTT